MCAYVSVNECVCGVCIYIERDEYRHRYKYRMWAVVCDGRWQMGISVTWVGSELSTRCVYFVGGKVLTQVRGIFLRLRA